MAAPELQAVVIEGHQFMDHELFRPIQHLRHEVIRVIKGWLPTRTDRMDTDWVDRIPGVIHVCILYRGRPIAYMRLLPGNQFREFMAWRNFVLFYRPLIAEYQDFVQDHRHQVIEVSRLVTAFIEPKIHKRALAMLFKTSTREAWKRNWEYWIICTEVEFYQTLKEDMRVCFLDHLYTRYSRCVGSVISLPETSLALPPDCPYFSHPQVVMSSSSEMSSSISHL